LPCVPATATAFDWAAQVGLLYDRSDTWAENIPRTTQPRLDLDLRLDLRGAIGGPGILAYGGSAAYRRTTTELNGERTGLDNVLTYNVEAAVLQNRKSPVGLTLFTRDMRVRDVNADFDVAAYSHNRPRDVVLKRAFPLPRVVGEKIHFQIDLFCPDHVG